MTDRDLAGLRGPVQSCEHQTTAFTRQCGATDCSTREIIHSTQYEYHANGSVVREVHSNEDGSEWSTLRDYDIAGKLISKATSMGTARVSESRFEYDAQDRLVRVISRNSAGREHVAETHAYELGRKTRISHFDVASRHPDTVHAFCVEGSDHAYRASNAATMTTIYDLDEKLSEVFFHDAAHQLVNCVEFHYDSRRNLIEEVQFPSDDSIPADFPPNMPKEVRELFRRVLKEAGRQSYRYDEAGRRTERISHLGPMGEDQEMWNYNEQGDVVSEIHHSVHREFGLDAQGELLSEPSRESVSNWEVRFVYEYDSHGNWTKKTTEGWNANNSPVISAIESRKITYWPEALSKKS